MNFLGALGALGRLLPGYVQGREAAIRGNWNDLNQFNQVHAGQLQNAFSELDLPLAYNRDVDAALTSRLGALTNQQQFNEYMVGGPGRLAGARMLNQYTPALTFMGIQDQLGNYMQQQSLRQLMNQWNMNLPQGAQTNSSGGIGGAQQTPPTAANEQNVRQSIQ